MIYSLIHPGSGLGNQLFRIIAGRVLALDKGYEYSPIGTGYFKGKSFMCSDLVERSEPKLMVSIEKGGKIQVRESIPLWEEKTNYYNPEFNFIEDNTIIDGEFQSIQYFGHRLNEINKWLKTEPLSCDESLCVIGFRGGEFYAFPELGLPKEYFDEGIRTMKEVNPNMKFEVHTDDPVLATQFFPDYKVIHDIGINWRTMRYAKYAIIANSSFFIFPRLLRHNQFPKDFINKSITIAPRYWARRNIQEWSRPDNFYDQFMYV